MKLSEKEALNLIGKRIKVLSYPTGKPKNWAVGLFFQIYNVCPLNTVSPGIFLWVVCVRSLDGSFTIDIDPEDSFEIVNF